MPEQKIRGTRIQGIAIKEKYKRIGAGKTSPSLDINSSPTFTSWFQFCFLQSHPKPFLQCFTAQMRNPLGELPSLSLLSPQLSQGTEFLLSALLAALTPDIFIFPRTAAILPCSRSRVNQFIRKWLPPMWFSAQIFHTNHSFPLRTAFGWQQGNY